MAKKKALEAMSQEEVAELSTLVGTKVRDMCDQTANKINKLLSKYGIKAKIAIQLEDARAPQKADNLKNA